jgi:hypothetical protein
MSITITAEQLRMQVADAVLASMGGAIEGASEDVRTALSQASDRMIRALAAGRPDLAAMVERQLVVIAERNRVRFASGQARAVQASLTAAASFAVGLIDHGLVRLADGLDSALDELEREAGQE